MDSKDDIIFDDENETRAGDDASGGDDAVAQPDTAPGDEADSASGDTAGEDTIGLPAGAGAVLRAAREGRRLTLEHVAAETRIPIRHLQTIEAGDFEDLPSRTYAIGFARSYARAVDLEEEAIADLVREEMGNAGPRYSSVGQGMEPGDPAKLPSAGLAWFGGIAALILAMGVIAFSSTYFGAGEGPGSLVPETDRGDAAQAEGGSTGGGTATRPKGGASKAPAGAPGADAQVVFTALEDGVWVRFYEEGGDRLFEAQMSSGDTFALPRTATEPRINTGRPDAFAITIGGRAVPKLAEEPVTMGDTPISAAALLARPKN